ncbi:MAG: D-arabinono-1,4-lactone oxidase [Nitrospirota bacterium]
MQHEWRNWSGSFRFTPASTEAPAGEEELSKIVQRAAAEGRTVRVVGAGHSSSPLVQTEDILISMERLKGVESHDTSVREVTIKSGMMLREANRAFLDLGLALENLGDVDLQSLGGAIGTGTHGTGKRLHILSHHLIGGRLINGRGELIEFSMERDPDFVLAARVVLGTLGIFTALKLRLVPVFHLHRKEWCTHIEDCMANLDRLIEENRNFDFYWYPRSDEAKLRTLNFEEEEQRAIPYARCVKEMSGWSGEVIPRQRELRFDEIEFFFPAESAPACFREVRKRVKQRHRKNVGWRVLYRTIAADDAYLSGAHGCDSATISLHQNTMLPYEEYFKDIESIFRAYGGRPHWGKKHYLKAEDLKPLYPLWDRFLEFRQQMDPEGVFLNPYLGEILGCERAASLRA